MQMPPKSLVETFFGLLNTNAFGGALPEIPVHYCRMRAYGAAEPATDRYPHGRIFLGTMTPWPPCGWVGVLLHEMVHVYLDLQGVDEYEHGTPAYHGPRFTAECNRIGAVLGWPPVEEHDSGAWPHVHTWGDCEPDEED
jgi:hypothetical protein